MKLSLDEHVGPILALVAVQVAGMMTLFAAIGLLTLGYVFPFAQKLLELAGHFPLPEVGILPLPIIGLLHVAFYAVVAGLAISGNRRCRWLLVLLVLLHAGAIVFNQPWKLGRTF